MSKINEQLKDGALDLDAPTLGKIDSKFSVDQNKAKNNRIGDFPDGSASANTAMPNGGETKVAGDQAKDGKVFVEDSKSSDEFLKRITKFIADMEDLTHLTVNGTSI